jgi:3-deoxy-7-phosphoheptulonate synthase
LARHGVAFQAIERRGGQMLFSFANHRAAQAELAHLEAVEKLHAFDGPFGLVSRQFQREDTLVPFGECTIGGGGLVVIAGPCSVESQRQIDEVARRVRVAGAHGLRGGAYKPRTSPYAFQGHGRKGLELLARAREITGLPVVTEVMAPEDVPLVAEHADMLQVGSRNIQNFRLLEAVGLCDRPVLLKRGMMSTIDEFLAAAEYVAARGNTKIVLCERGIRTFETRLRNTLDLAAVALLKELTHLPVFVDPSHGTGLSELVAPMARAAAAVGADGLLIEVHPNPAEALSDGRQSLTPAAFGELMQSLDAVSRAVGRPLARPSVLAAHAR